MLSLGGYLWEVVVYESLRFIRLKFCFIVYMVVVEIYFMIECFICVKLS